MSEAEQKIARLHEICGDALDEVRENFKEPVKMSLLVRNPAYPDGSRDVLVTDDTAPAIALGAPFSPHHPGPRIRPMASNEMIEKVAQAIALATDEVDDHIGIFDYTSYGKTPGHGAHVVVDNRDDAILAEGKDSDDAHRLYNEYRDKHLARAAITAHIAALSAEGLVVVPRKPTPHMIEAAAMTFVRENGGIEHAPATSWRAMIAASPPPASGEGKP